MCRNKSPSKSRHFAAEVILWAMHWYLQVPISYRELALMQDNRGVSVDHTTLDRWIQAYTPALDERLRPHLRMARGSWRVNATCINVKGRWVPRCGKDAPQRTYLGMQFLAVISVEKNNYDSTTSRL